MIEIVPVHDKAFWRVRTNLDGSEYTLTFDWNGRHGAWHVGLLDATGAVLVQGLTLVSNRPLFRRFKSKRGMPPGDLVALDATGTIPTAGYDQLGPPSPPAPDADDARAAGSRGGVRLIYFEESDGLA
jgi:hypothetical protein